MSSILHVTEALGGGVATALLQIVRATPHYKHYLLAATRREDHVEVAWDQAGVEKRDLPRDLRKAIKAIRAADADVEPKHVHLHSSFAGAWGRLAFLPRERIIYTPHCYAFERRDVALPLRAAYYLAEQLLALGGGCVAAVSPREARLAKSMLFPQRVVLTPNAVSDPFLKPRAALTPNRPLQVVMMGRAAPQKDPAFMAATVRLARKQKLAMEFHWLGDGPAREHLEKEGIKVSGWKPQREIWRLASTADLYFHTAAWEGCPMAVLEAAALDIPILGRAIPSLKTLPLEGTVGSPEAALRTLMALAKGEGWDVLQANAASVRAAYAPAVQAKALSELYGS